MTVPEPGDNLVLSLFPGVGLLDRAFSEAGFCVCAGPDLVTGGDIREFRGVAGKFDGVIGGPPCQGFSKANIHRGDSSHESVINSREMLRQFVRVVEECEPAWFLCENVPSVPDIRVTLRSRFYHVQRVVISDAECGGSQIRFRHVQFGHRDGLVIRPKRVTSRRRSGPAPVAITTKPSAKSQTFAKQCRKQGLKETLKLPGWSKEAKFRAVGNGVPLTIGRSLAAAVACAGQRVESDCPCGCGRQLTGKQKSATAACRKRLQRDRDGARPVVSIDGYQE